MPAEAEQGEVIHPSQKSDTPSQSLLSKIVSTPLIIALYIYLMGIPISAIYFNYQYARQHGFVEWLFFGEIVPTLKAPIWPYFAFAGTASSDEDSPRIKAEWESFKRSIRLRNEAVNALDPPLAGTKSWVIPKETMDATRTKFREALSEANSVSDDLLDKIHPDLRTHYREEFTKAIELQLHGLSEDMSDDYQKGSLLSLKFGEWYEKHQSDLRNAEKLFRAP